MGMLKTAFMNLMPSFPQSPEVVMGKLDNLFESYKKLGYIINCFIGILDPTNDVIICTNAGQPYPIVYNVRQGNQEFINLPSTSLCFGSSSGTHYKKHEISLRHKIMVIYSQGASDIVDDNVSSSSKFIDLVGSILKSNSPNHAESIKNTIKDYSINLPWREDITIMTIQNSI